VLKYEVVKAVLRAANPLEDDDKTVEQIPPADPGDDSVPTPTVDPQFACV